MKAEHSGKHNHLLIMLACCALMVIVALVLFRYVSSPWLWLMLLLCPLLHLWMMKDMFTKKEDCH